LNLTTPHVLLTDKEKLQVRPFAAAVLQRETAGASLRCSSSTAGALLLSHLTVPSLLAQTGTPSRLWIHQTRR